LTASIDPCACSFSSFLPLFRPRCRSPLFYTKQCSREGQFVPPPSYALYFHSFPPLPLPFFLLCVESKMIFGFCGLNRRPILSVIESCHSPLPFPLLPLPWLTGGTTAFSDQSSRHAERGSFVPFSGKLPLSPPLRIKLLPAIIFPQWRHCDP